jgi:hypothetical protein
MLGPGEVGVCKEFGGGFGRQTLSYNDDLRTFGATSVRTRPRAGKTLWRLSAHPARGLIKP